MPALKKPKPAPAALNTNQSSSVQLLPRSRSQAVAEVPDAACEPPILLSPYPLAHRSALFRRAYRDCIGRTVHSVGFGGHRLAPNANDIRQTIDCLGFERVREDSMTAAARDNDKLTLAISIARNSPDLSGPGYLIMRPFVEPMNQLCSKWLLVQSMRRLEAAMHLAGGAFFTGSGRKFTHEEFTAFTINLGDASLEKVLGQRPGMYLAKPVRGTMGQGQQLVPIRSNRVPEDLLQFLLSSKFQTRPQSQVILQRYVDRPLLIDKRKFDMRVYYMVVNAKRPPPAPGGPAQSGYFAFLHPGFVRLCSAPYDLAQTDLAVHLTNQSVQAKRASTFAQLKEVTTWYPDELNRYLNRRRRPGIQRDWARDVMYPKVGAILGYVSTLFRRHLDDASFPASTFRILGVDMLVDADLRVYLLEFNEFPAWGRQTSVLQVIKPNVWREAACLVSEVAIRFRVRQPITEHQLLTRQNFRLICSSEDPDLVRRNIAALYCD